MRAQVVVAGVSASNWIPCDQYISPFALGWGVVKTGTGDVTYSVQYTFNNMLTNSPTSAATAFDNVSGKTTTLDGSITVPVAAVRLNITAASGAASLEMTVLQAGRP